MSKLIIEMEIPKRCIECGVRLKCKRYVCGLYQDIAEDLNPLMGDKDCLIKGELVQCGECRRAIPFSVAGNRDAFCHCDLFDATMTRKDFCSYGERKEKTDE